MKKTALTGQTLDVDEIRRLIDDFSKTQSKYTCCPDRHSMIRLEMKNPKPYFEHKLSIEPLERKLTKVSLCWFEQVRGIIVEEKEIEELIKRHMAASNSLDMDSFMETWADDAEFIYLLSNRVVKGKENLRSFFQETMFGPVTKLKTEITQEVRFREYRTYLKRVTECSNPEFVGLEFHWTLEFEDGKIKRVWALQ